jgi:CheY-like chemotaxis protein
MALGALISAYQEDEAGGLRALLPLAGRTLLEYQARCAAAAGAAPIVVLVERVPAVLNAAFERLRAEGISVVPVSDGNEAASRFEPGTPVLQIADGLAPAMALVERIAGADQRAVATLPDHAVHDQFERIDNDHRWAGVALIDGSTLSSTAAMLGDWDLQSTLLRRTLQAGAVHVPAGEGATPFLAHAEADPQKFDRHLLLTSRKARRDWPSRYVLPLVEEFATEQLMRSPVRPEWLIQAALVLMAVAALLFTRGYNWVALALLLLATPLDIIAERLATLRMQPLPAGMLSRRLLWPAAGLALLGLGWFEFRHGEGWGALVSGLTAGAFAQAMRTERHGRDIPAEQWLFGVRPAIFTVVPFALFGWWSAALGALAVYAAASFFVVQHLVYRIARD